MTDSTRLISGTLWFVLAGFAASVFHRERERPATRGTSLVWAAFAGLLVLIAFLSLTNFGNELVDELRKTARTEGWYSARRPMQAKVVVASTLIVVAGYAWSLIRLGSRVRRYGLVMTAFAWIAGFTAVRTISLHQIDAVLGAGIGPLTFGKALNAVGVLLAVSAIFLGWRGAGTSQKHVA